MNDNNPNTTTAIPAGTRNLFTVAEFVQQPEFNFLTDKAMRMLIFHGQPRFSSGGEKVDGNGLIESGAIIKLGRKTLIDAEKFRAWINSQRLTSACT